MRKHFMVMVASFMALTGCGEGTNKVDNMENELILGLRKLEGISLEKFFDKFEENMQNIFPIKPLVKSGDLIYKDGYIYINPKKLYVMNEILLKLI